jgi:hypothetical protein
MSKSRDTDYEVGYGRPPKETQFKKGRSGNPGGRPKRPTDAAGIFREILSEPLTIREGESDLKMSAEEAVMYAQVRKAMQGNVSAFDAVLKLARSYGIIKEISESNGRTTGRFLVVPDPVTPEEWDEMARRHYARMEAISKVPPEEADELLERLRAEDGD